MSHDYVLEMVRDMMWLVAIVVGPLMAAGLVVGILVGVVQSATQIQEATLTFVPKLMVFALALVFGGNWALDKLVTFTGHVLQEIAHLAPRDSGT